MTSTSYRISVIGAGFAGLTAARQLRRQLPTAEITLIAPTPEFVYYPSLIWVPTGLRGGNDLRVDLMPFLKRQRLAFHAGRVTGLVDAYDRGMLVYRTERRSLVVPPLRLLHWSKRAFEWNDLRSLRAGR